MDNTQLKRLIWHSRRGMLELDLLLVPFARHELANLSDDEQQTYARLLTNQDPDIYVWLTKQAVCPAQDIAQLIVKIQAYAATAPSH